MKFFRCSFIYSVTAASSLDPRVPVFFARDPEKLVALSKQYAAESRQQESQQQITPYEPMSPSQRTTPHESMSPSQRPTPNVRANIYEHRENANNYDRYPLRHQEQRYRYEKPNVYDQQERANFYEPSESTNVYEPHEKPTGRPYKSRPRTTPYSSTRGRFRDREVYEQAEPLEESAPEDEQVVARPPIRPSSQGGSRARLNSLQPVYHPQLPSRIMIPSDYEVESVLQLEGKRARDRLATATNRHETMVEAPQDDEEAGANTEEPRYGDEAEEEQPAATDEESNETGGLETDDPQPMTLPHPPQALPYGLAQLDAAIERLKLASHEVHGPTIPVITISGQPKEYIYERTVPVPQPDPVAVPEETTQAINDHQQLSNRQKVYLRSVLGNYFKLIKDLQKKDVRNNQGESARVVVPEAAAEATMNGDHQYQRGRDALETQSEFVEQHQHQHQPIRRRYII